MKNEITSLITDGGGLEITLTPNEVTWFLFLQASRTTNSLKGGWNSKTHWLQVLNLLGSKLMSSPKTGPSGKRENPAKWAA